MEERKKYFMDCHVAGRKYHEADEVWDKLKVGTQLQLVHDKENRHDPDAVAIMYTKPGDKRPYCIGYVPSEDNETIAQLLEMGWHVIIVWECSLKTSSREQSLQNIAAAIKQNIKDKT